MKRYLQHFALVLALCLVASIALDAEPLRAFLSSIVVALVLPLYTLPERNNDRAKR